VQAVRAELAMKGWVRERPWLAIAMTLFLLSLAGIPPLAGLVGKTMPFGVAMGAGFAWLAAVAAANSALSLYSYVLPIRGCTCSRRTRRSANSPTGALGSAITLSLGLTILAGIVPEPLVALARMAARCCMVEPVPSPPGLHDLPDTSTLASVVHAQR
jgi:NADH-quinone oxidoreductase subunit N